MVSRRFNDSIWYYNAGDLPTVALVVPHTHLFNRVYYGLETQVDMLSVLYEPHAYPYWRNVFAVHTSVVHRFDLPYDALHNAEITEINVRNLDNAFGEMARSVLFGTSDFVSPDSPVLSVAELSARKDRGEDLTRRRPGHERTFFEPFLNQA